MSYKYKYERYWKCICLYILCVNLFNFWTTNRLNLMFTKLTFCLLALLEYYAFWLLQIQRSPVNFLQVLGGLVHSSVFLFSGLLHSSCPEKNRDNISIPFLVVFFKESADYCKRRVRTTKSQPKKCERSAIKISEGPFL